MSVLSATTQRQVEDRLVADGVLSRDKLKELRDKATKDSKPLFGLLVTEGHLTDEQLTKTTALVTKVPYVNLTNVQIAPEVLSLLPQEIAERYMAVPLGEMQRRLVVAMLDADNVQAVDFLANKIGRPLKVYAASEEGIRNVIKQYDNATIGNRLEQALGNTSTEPADDNTEKSSPGKGRKGSGLVQENKKIQTIVQDSPISKALSTILEYAAKNRASDIHI
jgi:type IV pilus assembly protein PilB